MTQTLLEQWVQRSSKKPIEAVSVTESAATGYIVTTVDKSDVPATSSPIQEVNKLYDQLPPNVILSTPEKEDIPRLKRLNSLLLPIPYPESFYKEIVSDLQAQSLTLLAFWKGSTVSEDSTLSKGQLIGAVRCRLLPSNGSPGSNGPMLYLSTLVLLSPYRSLGIASHMLNVLIRRGVQEYGVTSIGAHVWDANTAALEWYHKRGFKEVGHEPEYYRKLNPQGAKIMSRQLSVLDLTGG
ncbi:hypothetical protein AMS68_005480 [Peltaster fructicola]|uniref:N-acetyltransferase domain-containing protein n=1 Tax=Peltaster fructicola TaxID=286661 RepID=A0A6H0XYX8_9PEZI|nr:hypothetical protein AMS68_005480 [Peltaster fructicola]